MEQLNIVLASKSPRRQSLVKELGFPCEVRTKEVEEIYPADLDIYKVPDFLAELKSTPFDGTLERHQVLLTSDTIVINNGTILGKPKSEEDAASMIRSLSGSMHEVVTGVCLKGTNKTIRFSNITKVYFSELTEEEIQHYVSKYKPMDKAGSYGIQEWIGYIGVKKIEGCYYNVMGLPLNATYAALKENFL